MLEKKYGINPVGMRGYITHFFAGTGDYYPKDTLIVNAIYNKKTHKIITSLPNLLNWEEFDGEVYYFIAPLNSF